MSRIVFLRMDGDNQVEVRMNGDATWMEVTSKFVDFLRGAGYGVTEQDVGDFLSSQDMVPTPMCEGYTTNVSAADDDNQTVFVYDANMSTSRQYNFDSLTQATATWFNK